MKLDYLNEKNKDFKAACGFIFGGSATIGVINAGYNVDQVLEMTEDMDEYNAYHFTRNFSIPVVKPSDWENDSYLYKLKEKNYDLMLFNPPCSSLSQINRNASVDGKNNIHFYRVFNIISKVEPKTFIIENAPTLIKLGYPILKDLTHQLGDKYRFTIIRDFAGNHNVPMKRMRTLIVGWHKNTFNKIPLLHANIQPTYTTKDCIGDLYNVPLNSLPNHNCIENETFDQYSHLFDKYVDPSSSSAQSFIKYWDEVKDIFEEKDRIFIEKIMDKLNKGQNVWDKSPYKPDENTTCPSMTSVTKIIHPKNSRMFTVREYARLMNYPDDFVFYDECKTPIIQCIAQGVPANFIEYISNEVKQALLNNRDMIDGSENCVLSFQHHTKMKFDVYKQEEVDSLKELDVNKKSKIMNK